jgi:hypothetical protein
LEVLQPLAVLAKFPKWQNIQRCLSSPDFGEEITSQIGVSQQVLSLITMNFAEAMSTKKVPEQQQLGRTPLSSAQADVVAFIAGAVLRKLQARYKRFNQDDLVNIIQRLTKQKPDEERLIEAKSRGGLLQPSDNFIRFMCESVELFNARTLSVT